MIRNFSSNVISLLFSDEDTEDKENEIEKYFSHYFPLKKAFNIQFNLRLNLKKIRNVLITNFTKFPTTMSILSLL